MKCPKCHADMRREKTKVHSYRYVCPVCRFELKPKQTKEEDQTPLATE